MSDFIDYDSEPPFADSGSVLYVETERKAEYHDITANMTPQQVAQCIAEVFHDNYQLILIMEALGKVKEESTAVMLKLTGGLGGLGGGLPF